MTSKIVVNNIEADAGVSTVTFNSNISVGNSVTATSFHGDGSNLTGAGPTLTNGADNRVVTATGANALNAETGVVITSDSELIVGMTGGGGATPDARLQVRGDTFAKAQIQVLSTHNDDNPASLQISKSRSSGNTILGDNDDIGQINFGGNDGNGYHNVGRIMVSSSGEGNGNDDLPTMMRFFTTANGSASLTERLRIKSDGKVNITPGGALSGSHPPGDLNIVGTNFLTMTPNDNANASDNEVLGVVAFLPYAAGSIAAASAKIEAVAESGQSGSSNATSLRFYNKNSSTGPGNSGIERMRITSNANGTGALYINQTSEVSGANSHLVVNNSVAIVTGSTFRSFYMSGNGNAYFWNGSNQPYISSGGSFTNASDVSLKKDITDLTYGINVLKNLKPRKYKMKADDKEQIGFIAQEVEADVPEVVEASETPNGDQHKGLAYGNLTAVLTKALQEAVTKIETLEAKVAALEGS